MSDRQKTQNDKAWEALFEKYHILRQIKERGFFRISAGQIKEYREPRLMAKFDHRINLPHIFGENRLAILPVSRGDYVISHFEAYQRFEDTQPAALQVALPDHLQSLNANSIPSEAIAINCALASGMLSDFLGEKQLFSTVSGRMGSGTFDFDIYNVETGTMSSIEVNHSQIEIDAAFEGEESLALVEAKRDISEDFLIRQLYYPFRVWSQRVSKKVRPVFLVYSNGIFSLYEYEFRDARNYNSLALVKHRNYCIEDMAITMEDLRQVMEVVRTAPEPEITFPQADSFQRVINICELLSAQELSREQVTEEYAFDLRQTNYYTDAARYLGLVEKRYESQRKPVYRLTARGKGLMKLGYRQRQLAFCSCILEHRPFYEVLGRYLETGEMPHRNQVIEVMKDSELYGVSSDSTFIRRASTVNGWVNWMRNLAAVK